MRDQEFLLLGLLRERHKHGYEIKKGIRDIVSALSGLRPTSIYYPLKKMEAEGLLVKKAGKAGRRPEKYVYALTARGIARFELLLTRYLINVDRPFFSLDLCLYFLPYAVPEQVRKRLLARLKILKKLEQGISASLESSRSRNDKRLSLIFSHDLEMIRAEQTSAQQLLGEL